MNQARKTWNYRIQNWNTNETVCGSVHSTKLNFVIQDAWFMLDW